MQINFGLEAFLFGRQKSWLNKDHKYPIGHQNENVRTPFKWL